LELLSSGVVSSARLGSAQLRSATSLFSTPTHGSAGGAGDSWPLQRSDSDQWWTRGELAKSGNGVSYSRTAVYLASERRRLDLHRHRHRHRSLLIRLRLLIGESDSQRGHGRIEERGEDEVIEIRVG
jgi:hypothetical protein